MSKYIYFIISLLFCLPVTAQIRQIKGSGYILTQERKTDHFVNIDVSDHISVYIVQGTFSALTVEADNNLFPYIKTEVENNTLKIFVPDSIHIVKFTFMNVLIRLPEIHTLTAQQHSLINAVPQLWKSKAISLFASSGSKIHLATTATHLKVSAKTAATIELKGNCEQLEATLNNDSHLYARNLQVQKAALTLSNNSTADINVQQELQYDVKENSRLLYKGRPKLIASQSSPNSKVIQRR